MCDRNEVGTPQNPDLLPKEEGTQGRRLGTTRTRGNPQICCPLRSTTSRNAVFKCMESSGTEWCCNRGR